MSLQAPTKIAEADIIRSHCTYAFSCIVKCSKLPGNFYTTTPGSLIKTYSCSKTREKQDKQRKPRPRGYKTFSMLNSAEQEIYSAHKN